MLKKSKEKAEVMSLRQVYCENSGVYVVFGNVFLQWVQNRGRDQVLEVLYAAREQQTIHYTQVLYSAFNEESKNLPISVAELLPVKALCELKHAQAMIRMLKGGVRNIEALLDEAEAAGCHLYLHYVGEKDEYPILAKDVTITIDE